MLVMGLLVLGLAGCQSNHVKQVNTANKRWKSLRSDMMLQMAQRQFDAGNLDQAEVSLVEAISVDGDNPYLHVLGGRIGLERGKLERAYNRLQHAIEIDETIPQAHYYQGIVLQRWTQFDAALVQYRQAFDLEGDNPAYLLAMAEMLVELNRTDEAIELLFDKMVYFDQNAGIRMAIGQLYAMRDDYKQAANYFQLASLLAPEDLRILEELAIAQMADGQYDKAIQTFERLCTEPELADRRDLRRTLAMAYILTERRADARAVYIDLTRTDPKDVEAWIKLGEVSLTSQDTSGTLMAANRVRALAPHRYEGYLLAGLVWQKRQRADRALKMFEQAAQMSPDYAEPMILQGIILEQTGQVKAAAKAYTKALRRQPDDLRAKRLLAQVTATDLDQ